MDDEAGAVEHDDADNVKELVDGAVAADGEAIGDEEDEKEAGK